MVAAATRGESGCVDGGLDSDERVSPCTAPDVPTGLATGPSVCIAFITPRAVCTSLAFLSLASTRTYSPHIRENGKLANSLRRITQTWGESRQLGYGLANSRDEDCSVSSAFITPALLRMAPVPWRTADSRHPGVTVDAGNVFSAVQGAARGGSR